MSKGKWGNYESPVENTGFDTIGVGKEEPLQYRIAEDFFLEVGIHFVTKPDGKLTVEVCRNQTWDEDNHYNRRIVDNDCPICKIANETGNDRMSVKRIFAMNAIIRGLNDGEDVVKILEAKKTMFDDIMKHANDEEWGSPTRYDFKTKREGSGLKTQYITKASPNINPLTEDEKALIKEGRKDLVEFYQPKSVEELNKVMGADVDDGFEDTGNSPAPATNNDDFDEFDDEFEDF
ncbi:MAG: hypothetical protein ACOCRO_05705 [Halanaerobiales bacterium]